jgi:hypothetical protein
VHRRLEQEQQLQQLKRLLVSVSHVRRRSWNVPTTRHWRSS